MSLAEQPDPGDIDAIRRCIADYCDGYFTADPARMERCLHPELVKRTVAEGGVRTLTAERMVQITSGGGGSDAPAEERLWEIGSLDIRGAIASAVVVSYPYVDYLHLGRFEGGWRIVNALWADR